MTKLFKGALIAGLVWVAITVGSWVNRRLDEPP